VQKQKLLNSACIGKGVNYQTAGHVVLSTVRPMGKWFVSVHKSKKLSHFANKCQQAHHYIQSMYAEM
jgi:hypothetical protein